MHWIAPSEKDSANGTLEKRLWDAADQFRANSGLKAQEYSSPVLGLIFLRFADVRFAAKDRAIAHGVVQSEKFVEFHGGNCAATWRDFRGAKDHRGDISICER